HTAESRRHPLSERTTPRNVESSVQDKAADNSLHSKRIEEGTRIRDNQLPIAIHGVPAGMISPHPLQL
ncbi:MAG: hypothetical protein VXZ49_02330, partial [Planctomycetota bacterium]|nr:hypothetical protein [Planctomycetota bacterium]